jgi:hypothetical protein
MEQVDADRKREGEEPFFDSHYTQFQLASSHLALAAPSLFSPGSASVITRRRKMGTSVCSVGSRRRCMRPRRFGSWRSIGR